MIPLRMEHDYKPDGWLGILVGTKLFYDFSGKYDFRDKLDQLLKEITSIKRKANNEIKLGGVPKRLEPVSMLHYYHKYIITPPLTYTNSYSRWIRLNYHRLNIVFDDALRPFQYYFSYIRT